MEGWRSWVRSGLPSISSIPRPLLAVLLVYSFSSQFIPIEPYLVPYLTTIKHFTINQVAVHIFPVSVYAQLVFTLLMAPACYYLSHKVLIILGAFGVLFTYVLAWIGQSLLSMQLMQIAYGFGMSARLVFSAYIFLLVPEEEYQFMTSLITTTSLLSFLLASELGQLLALQRSSYQIFFVLSIIPLGICWIMSIMLPNDRSLSPMSSLANFSAPDQKGWIYLLKETWSHHNLRILSIWWAVAFAGFSLIQNYGTSLFDVIDSNSKFNGHILALAQAAGSLGAHCAIYIENFASKSGLLIYVLGMAFTGILCLCMGVIRKLWVAYFIYVVISGIYQILACLVSARCGRLVPSRQFILLFSINNFIGLIFETLLQAVVEICELSIFAQFKWFAGFFLVLAALFSGFGFIGAGSKPTMYSLLEVEDEQLMHANTPEVDICSHNPTC